MCFICWKKKKRNKKKENLGGLLYLSRVVPGFDPECSVGPMIPAWISLVKLLHEFKPLEGLVGPMYVVDPLNNQLRDLWLCTGLDIAAHDL